VTYLSGARGILAMANPGIGLSFHNLENGQAVVAFCGACGKRFEAEPKPGKKIDDQLLAVRAEFDAHDCKI
jgi:hypothetical protein